MHRLSTIYLYTRKNTQIFLDIRQINELFTNNINLREDVRKLGLAIERRWCFHHDNDPNTKIKWWLNGWIRRRSTFWNGRHSRKTLISSKTWGERWRSVLMQDIPRISTRWKWSAKKTGAKFHLLSIIIKNRLVWIFFYSSLSNIVCKLFIVLSKIPKMCLFT